MKTEAPVEVYSEHGMSILRYAGNTHRLFSKEHGYIGVYGSLCAALSYLGKEWL